MKKKTIQLMMLCSILLLSMAGWSQQIHQGEAFSLDTPIPANESHEFRALSHLALLSGFHARPESGNSVLLRISGQSLEEQSSKAQVYPNPVDQSLHINLSELELGRNVLVQIYNTRGQMCSSHTLNNPFKHLEINVEQLSSGLYYYAVTSAGKLIAKGKFVK